MLSLAGKSSVEESGLTVDFVFWTYICMFVFVYIFSCVFLHFYILLAECLPVEGLAEELLGCEEDFFLHLYCL